VSDKIECPACNSYTSDVARAFRDDRPCPTCGLSAEAAAEILAVRTARADEALKGRLEAALVRAGKAEAEASSLRIRLEAVREALEGDGSSW
jgi:hypothetical protein